MKIEKNIFLALISTLLLLYGCVGKHHGEPSETTPESLPLVIYADIAGSGSVLSKADRGTEDNWSYTAFQDKDVMGFYSSGGKLAG